MFYNYGQYRNQNGPVAQAPDHSDDAMMGYSATGAARRTPTFPVMRRRPDTISTIRQLRCSIAPAPGPLPCSAANSWLQVLTGRQNDQIPGNRISAGGDLHQQIHAAVRSIGDSDLPRVRQQHRHRLSDRTLQLVPGRPPRLRHEPENQVSIIVAFGRQASTGPNSSGAANQLGPPFNTNQAYTPKTNVDIVKDTYTINAHMVNQAAVAFGRYKSLSVTPDRSLSSLRARPGLTGTPAGQASYFPGITFSGGISSNDPTTEGGYDENQKVNNTYSAQDSCSGNSASTASTSAAQVVEVQFNYVKNLTNSSPLDLHFLNVTNRSFR